LKYEDVCWVECGVDDTGVCERRKTGTGVKSGGQEESEESEKSEIKNDSFCAKSRFFFFLETSNFVYHPITLKNC
jgi:hypothetical protein